MISYIFPYMDSRAEQFEETKKSLEAQTDQDFEIIVVPVKHTNPVIAQNEGARQAKGDILVLTSPEVVNATTNVEEIKLLPKGMFWLGHVVEIHQIELDGIYTKDVLREFVGMTEGITARCVAGNWDSWRYFIGAIYKEDYWAIGGMDEEFADGIAWEDREFASRVDANLKTAFNPNIVGVHLWHPRTYQDNGPELRQRNKDLFIKRSMYGQ